MEPPTNPRERWERVEQLFHSALGLDPASRAEYLMRECGGDDDLRRRVESLLGRDDATSPIDHPITSEPVYRSFGRYRLLSKLGEGGMGAVYLARDTQLNRDVALKVLPPVFAADAERKRRFLREARAASSLSHPNIVPVHDFGEEGGVEYFVMEYIRGKPLDRLIPRTGLKLDEALDYAIPIASALQAAHEAGIVHRDVKPGNVIVDERGVAKVLDFGIAKPTDERSASDPASTVTGEGMVIGTIAYMSPEQAEGRPVDTRSDIFSFGSLLYEMVTGRRAFERESNASTLTAILRDEPPRANSQVQELPAGLSVVLDRCLKKNPAERYQRMSDVVAALQRIRVSIGRPRRRISKPVRYGAAVLLLLVGVTAAWWLLRTGAVSLRSVGAPTKAGSDSDYRLLPLTSYPGEEISPSFSPDGNQVAFAHREPGNSPSHVFVKVVGQSDAVQLTRGPDADFDPSWSPDGRWIAFLRYSGPLSRGWPMMHGKWSLMLIPPIGGPERRVAELNFPEWPGSVSWHPDAKSIAVSDRSANGVDAAYLFSIENGAKRQLTMPRAGIKDWNPTFAPNGNSIVFTRVIDDTNRDLYVLELEGELTAKGEPRRLTFENGWVHHPTWAPDGRSVLYTAGSNHSPSLWRVWIQPNAREPQSPQRIVAAGVGVRTPVVSKTGRLAFAQYIIDVDIWRVDLSSSGVEVHRVVASTRTDHDVRISPDGTRLAFGSERSGAHEIWVSNTDGSNALQLTSFDGPYTAGPQWSPDGQWISFASRPGGSSAVYVIPAQGGAMRRLTDPRLRASGGAWTPDGQWIYCDMNGQLGKVPAHGGSPVQITRSGGSAGAQAPDGRTIYYLKEDAETSSLWTVPAEGGEERQILPAVYSKNFVVRKDGIYFIPGPENPAIWFFRFADRKTSMLAKLRSTPAYGMDVSKDGKMAMVAEYEDPGADILMIENFR